MKDFIKSRPALKQAVLARLIGWNASNFCLWMKGERPIPKEKERLLKDVLRKHGYGCEDDLKSESKVSEYWHKRFKKAEKFIFQNITGPEIEKSKKIDDYYKFIGD